MSEVNRCMWQLGKMHLTKKTYSGTTKILWGGEFF